MFKIEICGTISELVGDFMEKISEKDINLNHSTTLSSDNCVDTIKLINGDILRMYSPNLLNLLSSSQVNLEKKLMESEGKKISSSILRPKILVSSDDGQISGYITDGFDVRTTNFLSFIAKTIGKRNASFSKIASVYKKLEDVIKENPNVVFPCLCDLTDVYINSDKTFTFTGYDKMQIDGDETLFLSSSVLYSENIFKYTKDGRYTKNLDKKSLFHIFMLFAFGVDLTKLRRNISINEILTNVGIEDKALVDKINSMFYSMDDNEYLADDILRISESHKLKQIDINHDYSSPSKKLILKK